MHQFKGHLVLKFVDTFEKPGDSDWPDQMSEDEHKGICKYDEDKAPELSDAQRIVEFIGRHPRCTRRGGADRALRWRCEPLGCRRAVGGRVLPGAVAPVGRRLHLLDGAKPPVLRLLAKADVDH